MDGCLLSLSLFVLCRRELEDQGLETVSWKTWKNGDHSPNDDDVACLEPGNSRNWKNGHGGDIADLEPANIELLMTRADQTDLEPKRQLENKRTTRSKVTDETLSSVGELLSQFLEW